MTSPTHAMRLFSLKLQTGPSRLSCSDRKCPRDRFNPCVLSREGPNSIPCSSRPGSQMEQAFPFPRASDFSKQDTERTVFKGLFTSVQKGGFPSAGRLLLGRGHGNCRAHLDFLMSSPQAALPQRGRGARLHSAEARAPAPAHGPQALGPRPAAPGGLLLAELAQPGRPTSAALATAIYVPTAEAGLPAPRRERIVVVCLYLLKPGRERGLTDKTPQDACSAGPTAQETAAGLGQRGSLEHVWGNRGTRRRDRGPFEWTSYHPPLVCRGRP